MNPNCNSTFDQLNTTIGDLYENRKEFDRLPWHFLSPEQKFSRAACYIIESESSTASQMDYRAYAVKIARKSLDGAETIHADALLKVAEYIRTGYQSPLDAA